jgi:hypothetical protein
MNYYTSISLLYGWTVIHVLFIFICVLLYPMHLMFVRSNNAIMLLNAFTKPRRSCRPPFPAHPSCAQTTCLT